jgi:di/tricarboxylate transporter
MKDLSICLGIGLAMWFIPPPAGVALKAWHLLAVFVATIVGIITTPLPLGAVAILGLGAAMLTKVLTFAEAFSAFSSEIPWVARSAALPRCRPAVRAPARQAPSRSAPLTFGLSMPRGRASLAGSPTAPPPLPPQTAAG